MARVRRPAEGERAAIGGYYPQYLLSADLILRRLDEGRLEWIRMADPQAGRLDDFQIGMPNRVDAYQFKWSAHADTFTYSDLVREAREEGGGTRPSLIAQLADGWQLLRRANPGSRVIVHLTTNNIASPNTAELPVGDPPPARRTFANFLSEGWGPARRGETPAVWLPALEELRRLTGLTPEEFAALLPDCELEFGTPLPAPSADTRQVALRWQQSQTLVAFLQRAVQQGVVELSAEQLLRSLGWAGRYASRLRHEFPDPATPYLPIAASQKLLEDRIAVLRGGYLALVGSPGSGKSTLLTKALRRARPERVIRYYAYVPDAQDPAASRGESENFLHDVCLALQQAGVTTNDSYLQLELGLLLERFHRQLALLGEEYREAGRRTIILIDGLDHIDRELRPSRSLLADLPRPDQVPDGVFFVLGSQTDRLSGLSERIRHALDSDGRRIVIERLDRGSVREIVRGAGLPVGLSSAQLDSVFDLSDGHPLALGYLIQALRGAADECQAEAVLSAAESYGGDIEAQYRTYWPAVADDPALARLLGAVARLRGGADLELFGRWYGPDAVGRLASFRRYFVEDPGRRWRFFHNSFRVFLARETARDEWTGDVSEARDRQTHLDLASRFATEPEGSPLRWEEMYHRVRAGDHEGVCRLADQRRLRDQVFSLRPIDAVRTDVELALPSAAARDDVRAFVALTLFRTEAEKRASLLADFDLPGLLLDLDEPHRAVEAARDGNRMRVSTSRAMELAVRLAGHGEFAEARRLFEVGEPLDLLAGEWRQGSAQDAWKALDTWAEAAPCFRPLAEVLDAIAAAPLRELDHWRNDEGSEERLRCHLLVSAGQTLIAAARWDDLEVLLASIRGVTEPGREARFWLLLEATQECARDGEKARQFLERLTGEFTAGGLGPDQRVRLAEAVLRLRGDFEAARALVEGLPIPVPDLDRAGFRDDNDAIFGPLLRHARLLYRLGDRRSPAEMVAGGAVDCGGRELFLRDVVVVARIWAQAGGALTAWAVRQEVAGIMARFERPFGPGGEEHSWMVCRRARRWLYRMLVRAVAVHGREALAALRGAFNERWQGDGLRHWPPALRRKVALAFAEANDEHRTWAAEQLRRVAAEPEGDIYQFVSDSQEQASGWVALREADKAKALLGRVIRRTNGVVGKDYQFGHWLTWFDRLAGTDPVRSARLLDWLAASVAVLNETGDGVASSGASALIRTAARLDPGRASAAGRWLLDRGVIDHADRVKALLEGLMGSPCLPWRLAVLALAELVVPFDTAADGPLAESAVAAAHREAGGAAATWAAEYLARRIAIFAFPSAREGWRRGISAAATRLELPWSVAPSPAPPNPTEADLFPRRPDDRLPLDGGEELSLDEVIGRREGVTGLAVLARKESLESRFDWRPVFDRLLTRHRPEELAPLVRALRFKKRLAVDGILAAGKSRLAAGDRDGAYRLASLALEATDRLCWSRRYGDGSRLDVTRALIDARPLEGHKRLWNLLVTDSGRDPTALEEIVMQLRGAPAVAAVWPEVEDHLRALFDEHAAAAGIIPPDTATDASPVGPALAQLLLEAIDHPAAPVSRAARRAVAQGLLVGERDLSAAFRGLLSPAEPRCRAALETLDAASRRDASLPASMSQQLSALANCLDADLAFLASSLLGREPEATSRAVNATPALDGVLLQDNALRGLERPGFPEAGQPWPDTDDPRELLAIVRWAYDVLARATGRREIDLLHRGAQLMGKLVPRDRWSAAAERNLHRRLGDARLGFGYRRPRSDAALRATHRLIGELWSRGEIESWLAGCLVADLRLCDPALALAEPAPRPPEIPTIPTGIWADDQTDAWLDAASVSLGSLPNSLGDRVVLAESSKLEAVWRGSRRERRVSVLCSPADAWLLQDELLPHGRTCRVADYTASTAARTGCPVIGHPSGATDENPAGKWVALDPALACSLGWSLDPNGLFGWRDAEGDLMTESVWWQDGPAGMSGPLPEDCLGEGWLVLATAVGWTALREKLGEVVWVRSVTRTAALERGGERSVAARATDTVPLPPSGA